MPLPFFFFDPTMVLLLPGLFLAMWAQFKVKSSYARFSKVGTRSGLTGAKVAQYILQDVGINAVGLECIPGNLTDRYDPRSKTLRLSEAVYHGDSIAALGIAAHEVGHAIQHARMYAPLSIRNFIYPVSSLGSNLSYILFILGLVVTMFMHASWGMTLIHIAIPLFSLAVFFTVLTLPVEFNASSRALAALRNGDYLTTDELQGARKVLNAAALTYVAAAAMAILQLIRMILIAQARD